MTENDNICQFLKSRDIPCLLENDEESWKFGEVLYIVKDNKTREEINPRKLFEFKPTASVFTSDAKDISIDSDREANLCSDIPYTQTGYLSKSISVKINAPIMLTQNHSKRIFREDGICNGSRGFVVKVDFFNKPGQAAEISCIWIELYDKSGMLYKEEMKRTRKLFHPNPYAIPIVQISANFTLEKTRRKYRRVGFPLILGFCHTAHKIQVINITLFLTTY